MFDQNLLRCKLSSRSHGYFLEISLAFFLFLSVFPIITLIVFFASALSVSTDSIVQFMDTSVPKEIADLLLPYFIGNSVSIQVGFSMIVGFVVASNGAHSIIIASNALYKLDDSSYLNRRVKALFMTVILVFLFWLLVILYWILFFH